MKADVWAETHNAQWLEGNNNNPKILIAHNLDKATAEQIVRALLIIEPGCNAIVAE